jgi:hypothetical protein
VADALVVTRDSLRSLRDTHYTMRTARLRFRADRKVLPPGASFRAWARRTYNPEGAFGKLRELAEQGAIARRG